MYLSAEALRKGDEERALKWHLQRGAYIDLLIISTRRRL